MKANGLFRVFMHFKDTLVLCGTAFVVARDTADRRRYFLLTAYHVVAEIIAKSQTVLLQNLDIGSSLHSAQVVWVPSAVNSYSFGGDFALLELYVEVSCEFHIFSLKRYTSKQSELVIRGASAYSASTQHPEFRTLKVETHSLENMVEGTPTEPGQKEPHRSITMSISFAGNILRDDPTRKINETFLSPQEIFGGISGAPILLRDGATEFCVGLVSNIANDSVASNIFGVSSDTIIDCCLQPRGLFRELIGTEFPVDSVQQGGLTSQFNLLIDLVIADPSHFTLEDPDVEIQLWDKFSDLFYAGHPIDAMLGCGIESARFAFLSSDMQIALRYFLARLYFKRGQTQSALNEFAKIRKEENRVSRSVWARINSLMSSRTLIESPVADPDIGLDLMLRVGDKFGYLDSVNDEYIANEYASMLGRGLTNLFGIQHEFSTTSQKLINDIYSRHSNLLHEYPKRLCKQDVVNTSIGWLTNLWSISSKTDIQKLCLDVDTGFYQAEIRKNSIFHIQSLCCLAISKLLSEEYFSGTTILFLVIQLMRRERLHADHEGISQLLMFLRLRFPNYYGIFCIASKAADADFTLSDKLQLYRNNLNKNQLDQALIYSKTINDSLYGEVSELYSVKNANISQILP